MGKLERITVTMPEEMAAKMRAAVDSGEYATTSEIVREAMREWSDQQERREAALIRVRAIIAEGEKGPFHPAEEVFSRVRKHVVEQVAQATREKTA